MAQRRQLELDYELIVMKNVQMTWPTNNQLQIALYELFYVLCRRAKESADHSLINNVEKLHQFLLHHDNLDH